MTKRSWTEDILINYVKICLNAVIYKIGNYIKGVSSLTLATLLWGSSFPVIKIVMNMVNSFTYVGYRTLFAVLVLFPYVIRKMLRNFSKRDVINGLTTGIAYTLGLWLQGWGTGLTTAVNSAFITGLHVVFVHLYVALFEKRYSLSLGLELLLAVTGLYLLTTPSSGLGLGDFLVLLGAVAWATQVILVSKANPEDVFLFTFFEFIPPLTCLLISLTTSTVPSPSCLLYILYLSITCSVLAFSLQAYGQRYVQPEVAALIYLLEPVFAAIFAWAMLGEVMTPIQIAGAALILTAMIMATKTQK